MSDDKIRVGTTVDTSGLKAGASDAQTITAQMVADLKAQYAQAQTAVKSALTQMSEAQQVFATGVARGTQGAISTLEAYQAEVTKAVGTQNALKAQLDAASAAL